MRAFSCPAQYVRFVEAEIALAMAEVAEDQRRRADGRAARIHDRFIGTDSGRRIVILVADQDRDLSHLVRAGDAA